MKKALCLNLCNKINNLDIMNYILAFLAGLSAKLYDDLKDNKKIKYYKNKDVLEILKLFHMGAFVKVSFDYPLYSYFIGIVVLFNIIGDISCYKYVYERCLFIAIILFCPFFDNSKIKEPPVNTYWSILLLLPVLCIGAYIESKNIKEEFSVRKLCIRFLGIIWCCFAYYYFLPLYETISLIHMYVIGYLIVSVMVQIYSVFADDNKIKNKKKSICKKIKNKINKKE